MPSALVSLFMNLNELSPFKLQSQFEQELMGNVTFKSARDGYNIKIPRQEGETRKEWAKRTKERAGTIRAASGGNVTITHKNFNDGRIIAQTKQNTANNDSPGAEKERSTDTPFKIQIKVCGTHGLNNEEFTKITNVIKKALKGTDIEDPEFLLAHYDWSAGREKETTFSGHINVTEIGIENIRDWRLASHWLDKGANLQSLVSKALKGTKFENARVQCNSCAVASPAYEASDPEEPPFDRAILRFHSMTLPFFEKD